MRISLAEWRWAVAVSSLILLAAMAPNLWGYLAAPPGYHYTGLAYAWEDGASYIAKIRQGMQGAWLYTLAYTAEPGPPLFIYWNYLSLGHLAAWLGVEPEIIFHAARLSGGAVLLASLYAWVSRFFERLADRRLAFWLAATGGGFGWLTLTLGHPTADVLQAEIFPFLSVLANAHFPLASAALLWVMDALITPAGAPLTGRQAAQLTLGTLLLASTQAYGLVVAGGVAGLWAVLRWCKDRRLPASLAIRLGWVAALAAPFLVYYGLALATNPSYAGWDRQNVTLSPPVWDYLLAGGLILLLALVGAVSLKDPKGFKNPSGLGSSPASDLRDDANAFLLIIWPVVTAALVYLPVAQQRRFALAAIAPLAVLAVRGLLSLEALARYALLRCRVNAEPVTLNVLLRPYHSYRRAVLVGFSALTPLTLLLVTMGALNQTPANLFLTQGEWDGLLYLRQVGTARRESVRQTAPSALVLAAPDMGLLIPAFAGQRVIYGHPVETIQAAARREEVRRFYMGMDAAEAEAFLKPVDYIFVGPREKALAGAPVRAPVIPSSYRVSFSEGDVIIYQKQGE